MSATEGDRELLEVAARAAELAQAEGRAARPRPRAYRVRDVEVQWRDGKLEKINEATTRGLGLQLYVDGRYASVSTSDLRPEALERFIEDAVAHDAHARAGPVPRAARARALRGPGDGRPRARGPGLRDASTAASAGELRAGSSRPRRAAVQGRGGDPLRHDGVSRHALRERARPLERLRGRAARHRLLDSAPRSR